MNISVPIFEVCSVPYSVSVKDKAHWGVNSFRQSAYSVHSKTQSILLRFWNSPEREAIVDYPLLKYYKEDVDKCLTTLREYYSFVDYCAIIANLPAEQSIPAHIDTAPVFKTAHRIHFPIKTNPEVLFSCEDMEINMKEQTFYEISNSNCKHGVVNHSNKDRYHMILDLFTS